MIFLPRAASLPSQEFDLRNVYVTDGDVPLARDLHVRRFYPYTNMHSDASFNDKFNNQLMVNWKLNYTHKGLPMKGPAPHKNTISLEHSRLLGWHTNIHRGNGRNKIIQHPGCSSPAYTVKIGILRQFDAIGVGRDALLLLNYRWFTRQNKAGGMRAQCVEEETHCDCALCAGTPTEFCCFGSSFAVVAVAVITWALSSLQVLLRCC